MILLRGITLTADDDFAPLLKKRPRTKKPREKLSFMWQIPISILRIREQTRSNGRIKNGKRYGFDLYNQLVCKVCKLNFHKRIGLDVHNEDIHKQRSNKATTSNYKPRNYTPRQVVTNVSVKQTRSSFNKSSVVSSISKPTVTKQTSRRSKNLEQDLIDILDDDEDDDIIEIISDVGYNGNQSHNDAADVDDDIEIVEIVEKSDSEPEILSLGPSDYSWMEKSDLYQPFVLLRSDLNKAIRYSIVDDEIQEIDDEIEVVDQEEHAKKPTNKTKRKSTDVDVRSSMKRNKIHSEELLISDDEVEFVIDSSLVEVCLDESNDNNSEETDVEVVQLDFDDQHIENSSINEIVDFWKNDEETKRKEQEIKSMETIRKILGEESPVMRTKRRRRDLRPIIGRGL